MYLGRFKRFIIHFLIVMVLFGIQVPSRAYDAMFHSKTDYLCYSNPGFSDRFIAGILAEIEASDIRPVSFVDKNYDYFYVLLLFVIFQLIVITYLWISSITRKKIEKRLGKSEELFRLVQEATTDGVWDWNLQTGKVAWSSRCYTMLGYEPNEFESSYDKWRELVHPEDIRQCEQAVKKAIETGEPFRIEFRFQRKDGDWQWMLGRGKCVSWDANGVPIRAIGTHIDLTQRKLEEAALRKSESELKAIYENAPLLMLLVDRERRVIKMNDQALKFSGRTMDESVGLRGGEALRCVHAFDDPRGCGFGPQCKDCGVRNSILDTFDTGVPISCREIMIPYQDPAGQVDVCVLISTTLLEGFENDVVLICIEDISGRKHTENELRREKDFTESALNSQKDTFYLFDPETGKPLRWNKALCEITGYSDQEIAELPTPVSFYSEEDIERAIPFIQKVMEDGSGTIELDLICKDGHTVPFEYRVSVLLDETAYPKYLLSIGRDITERRNSEQKVCESEDRFRELFENLSSGVAIYRAVDDGEDFVFVDFNRAGEQIEHVDRKDIVGRRVSQVFPGVIELGLFDVFKQVWKTGESRHHPLSFYQDQKLSGWRDNFVYKLPSGEIVAIYEDKTEIKKAEQALKESESLLSASFSSIQDGMLILDKDFNIIRTNPVIETWCGLGMKVIGEKCFTCLRRQTQACESCPSRRAFETGKSAFEIIKGFEGSGVEWLEVYSFPMKNHDTGEITGVVEFLRDISDRKKAEEVLRESESKLREAQQMAQLGHWNWDVNTGEVEWSEQVYNIFRLDPSDFIPQIDSIQAMSPWPEEHQRDKELIQKAIKSHEQGEYEQKFIRPDGSIGYYYSTFQGIYNDNDDLIAMKGTVQDITERKLAEQQLLLQRERLDLAQEAAGMGMYDWNIIIDEAVCSGRYFEIFGLELKDRMLSEEDWLAMIHPDDRARAKKEVHEAFVNGIKYDTEYRIVWQDGTVKWVSSKAKMFYDEYGKAYRMIGAITDITERKQLILQLNMISKAIENSLNAFDIIDHNGTFIYANKAYLNMWGYDSIDEVVGTSPLSHCADSSIPARIISQVKESGDCIIEFKAKRKDDTLFDVLMYASLDYDYEGNEIYLGTSIDITDRKKNEETIKNYNIRLREEVKSRTKELSDKNLSLKNEIANRIKAENELKTTVSQLIQTEKLATVGQLAAGVAHEINTPLGAIGSSNTTIQNQFESILNNIDNEFEILKDNAELINKLICNISKSSNDLTSRQARQMKSQITEQLRQLEVEPSEMIASFLVSIGLVDNYQSYLPLFQKENSSQIIDLIRKISNIISGSRIIDTAVKQSSRVVYALRDYARPDQDAVMVKTDVRETIETALVLYGNRVKHGIELKVELEDVPAVLCHPHELCQIWTNLISNAVHAMKNHGALTIKLQCVENNIQVIISDTGCGIPEEIRDKVFDPMFTTKPVGEGTGLGLDIVKRIIERHNGTLELETKVGVGTTFTITIPIAE